MRTEEQREELVRLPALRVPETIEETGLEFGFLADLALKVVASDMDCTTERVSQKIKLPIAITEQLMQHLYREKLVEIRGRLGLQDHRYAMLDRGWDRVYRLYEMSRYIGPAPVSLSAYTDVIREQEQHREEIRTEQVRRALSHLVLSPATEQTLGLVLSSRRSLFVMGPPGNGKTSIAKALHAAQQESVWIPHAIEVDGQVIKVFDTHNHEPVATEAARRYDPRWIRIRRPLVIVGGELTIEAMDLIYSDTVRYYEAPFQLKANGGTLVIDDFGRQRVDPRDLLNRWIIPIEGRIDYLTLHTGKKIEVPFENLLVFATNLKPEEIVDDAFLRRMGYRLLIDSPDPAMYGQIFQRNLESRGLHFDSSLLETLFSFYARDERRMAACEPRDLIDRCADMCRLERRELSVTPELLEIAWNNYFGQRPR
jgi:hypothetical protein